MLIAIDLAKFIILCVITFFMCQVISNGKKRISFIGTILICLSTAVVEYMNSGLVEALIFGEVFIISLDNLLRCVKPKILWSLLIPISLLGFLLLSNFDFQITIGITILTLSLWRILEFFIQKKESERNLEKVSNKKEVSEKTDIKDNFKIDKKFILIAILGSIIVLIISSFFYRYEKLESFENRNGVGYLFNYTYSVMTPFNKDIKFEDSRALACLISIFPVALIIAVTYIFKYEDGKHTEFLMPTVIVTCFYVIFMVSNKITLLGIPNYILGIGLALLQIYMIVYIFSRIEERLFDLKKASYLSIIIGLLILIMPFPKAISSIRNRVNPYAIFITECFIILNYSDKRFWRLASWVFSVICVFESVRIFDFKLYNIRQIKDRAFVLTKNELRAI